MAKKKPAEPRQRPGQKNINVWLDEAVKDALDDYVDSLDPKPTLTAALESAIRKFLETKGFWPRRPPTDGTL